MPGRTGELEMARIEFTVEAVERDTGGPIICGRCSAAEIGVGDRFTALRRTTFRREDDTGSAVQVGSEEVAGVDLRVEEIRLYGRSVARVPHGWTAGIRFHGTGLEQLEALEPAPHVVWFLAGG